MTTTQAAQLQAIYDNILFDINVSTIINIGNFVMRGLSTPDTVDLSSYEGYQYFELYKNIFPVPVNVGYSLKDQRNGTHTGEITFSYNQDTGILSSKGTSSGNYFAYGNFDLYLIY